MAFKLSFVFGNGNLVDHHLQTLCGEFHSQLFQQYQRHCSGLTTSEIENLAAFIDISLQEWITACIRPNNS